MTKNYQLTIQTKSDKITLNYLGFKKFMLCDYINMTTKNDNRPYYSYIMHEGGVYVPYIIAIKVFKNDTDITEKINKFIYN